MDNGTLQALIDEARSIVSDAAGIQDLTGLAGTFPKDERQLIADSVAQRYRSWYARALEVLPPTEQPGFKYHYEGFPIFGSAIRGFLEQPLAVNPLFDAAAEKQIFTTPWLHAFAAKFKGPVHEQIVILERLVHRRPHVLRTPDRDLLVPRNLVGHVHALQAFLGEHSYEKNVFVMMRYRAHNKHIGDIIKAAIEATGRHPVLASDFHIIDELGPNVMACLMCCKYGVALFDEPEDGQAINPNVAYELGIMHFLDRDVLILKSKSVSLQSDILAKLYREYDPHRTGEIIEMVKSWFSGR